MSNISLIIGESGSGKSTSIGHIPELNIKGLDPKETYIFNSLGKKLPFKGSNKQYTYWNKDSNPNGNMIKTSSSAVVIQWLNFISQKMPHIKNIVIDDNTHQSSMEYIRRIKESTWDKWNDIAANMVGIVETCGNLRDDLNIFILHHVTETGDGIMEDKKMKAQTLGKLVDQKLSSYESFFTVVLLATKAVDTNGEIEYFFLTKDAGSTAKAPIGMFDTARIPNDLGYVKDCITAYYNGEELEEVNTKKSK